MENDIKIPLNLIFIMLDSCAIWPSVPNEQNAIRELQNLEAIGKIPNGLDLTPAVEEEIGKVSCPQVRNWSSGRNIAEISLETAEDKCRWHTISNVLFGNKSQLASGDKKDVDNIYNATGWGYTLFVTYDKKHILSKAAILWEKFHLHCVTPTECLKIIKAILDLQEA